MASERGDKRAAPPAYMAHGGGSDDATGQRGDSELRRMAAFRIRETANRLATLAHSAHNDDLRHDLKEIWQRLLQEERRLLGDPD